MNIISLYQRPRSGGCVIFNGELIACYSGHAGPDKAKAFHSALTKGETPETKTLARKSGIAYREVERALDLRVELALDGRPV